MNAGSTRRKVNQNLPWTEIPIHPMTRESEAALLEFCAHQREQFDEKAWLEVPHPDASEFRTAALFLAGVDWYGHEAPLRAVAKKLAADCPGRISELVKRTGFDLARFSVSLRRILNHESVVRAS